LNPFKKGNTDNRHKKAKNEPVKTEKVIDKIPNLLQPLVNKTTIPSNILPDNIESSDTLVTLLNTLSPQSKEDSKSFDLKAFTESYKKVIESLIDTKGSLLAKMSDLNENAVMSMSLLSTLGNYYEFKSINMFIDHFLQLRISKERLGRNELLEVGKMLQQLHSLDIMSNSPAMMNNPMMQGQMMNQMGNNPQQAGNTELPQQRRKRFKFF